VFAGYTIERRLGQGGMGAVYLARHPRLPRSYALKLLSPELSANPEFAARFEREAALAAGLDHPNIVSVHDRGSFAGQLWLSMQYVDGADCEQVLETAGGRLPPERAVRIVGEVAAALDVAHRHGLVHRDVKPANVLLAAPAHADDPERVLLTDFGIAKSMDEAVKLTATGNVLATFDYASPEQIEGRPLDGRTDVYSLGCLLYRLLTGALPYPGGTLGAAVYGHLHLPPPRPSDLVPTLPRALDGVVGTAMAKDPAGRYPDCRSLAAAARAALAAPDARPAEPFPPPAPPTVIGAVAPEPIGPVPSAQPPRRSVRTALIAAVAALLVAGAVTALVLLLPGDDRPTSRADDGSTPSTVAGAGASSTPATVTTVCRYLPDQSQNPNLVDVGTPPNPEETPAEGTSTLVMGTNQGDMRLTLDHATAPCAAASFTFLAGQGFFDDTVCHRLATLPDFGFLQCGDPGGTGTGGPSYRFAEEVTPGTTYPRGTVAMAKAAVPDSTGSQFFLVFTDTSLPPDYTVVGTVDEAGLAVLDRIAEAGIDGSNGPGDGAPNAQVTIESMTVVG
jgi:serine/threonine protein kinase/cyclophilin family peptidyl-prolyl cis-trans isomerase